MATETQAAVVPQTPGRASIVVPIKYRTFFDLPHQARKRIYQHLFHGGAPNPAVYATSRSVGHVPPWVPEGHLALLLASRAVHDEAEPILYRSVRLGSMANLAYSYLQFLGERRIYIRDVDLLYVCGQRCGNLKRPEIDWAPVFDLLASDSQWAPVRSLRVQTIGCAGRNLDSGPGCFQWPCGFETGSYFWRSLERLSKTDPIVFFSSPGHLVYELLERRCWVMFTGTTHFSLPGDAREGISLPTYILTNPWADPRWSGPPWQSPWRPSLTRHPSLGGGSWRPARPASSPSDGIVMEGFGQAARADRRSAPFRFLDLPMEVRECIYDLVCGERIFKWTWPPINGDWSTGVGLVYTCKAVAREIRPRLYRNIKIRAGSALAVLRAIGLDNTQYFRKVDIVFSCFCRLRKSPTCDSYLSVGTPPQDMLDPFSDPVLRRDWTAACKHYERVWTEVMTVIQQQRNLKELSITFTSYCREEPWRRDADGTWDTGLRVDDVLWGWRCCFDQENLFVKLLQKCQYAEKLTLRGEVPPTLGFRVQRSRPLSLGLRLQSMSAAMCDFIRHRLGDESSAVRKVPRDVTHFVLLRPGTALQLWEERVGSEGENSGSREATTYPTLEQIREGKSWAELRELLDYGLLEETDSEQEESEDESEDGTEGQ
ncbi:hypothetical protein VTK56DRAFT_4393 [Thermocarpiscus australiensis]